MRPLRGWRKLHKCTKLYNFATPVDRLLDLVSTAGLIKILKYILIAREYILLL